MRCMVCGEEMELVQSVPDETMLVPGFEHHKLVCPCCHDEERRLVFIRHPAPLSPPMEAEGSGSDFVDATLRPIDETPRPWTALCTSSAAWDRRERPRLSAEVRLHLLQPSP